MTVTHAKMLRMMTMAVIALVAATDPVEFRKIWMKAYT
jgi:hypothetical protein